MQTYDALRKAPRTDLNDTFPLSVPLALYVEPTNVCNFRCVLCPESFPDYQARAGYYQRMSMPLYEKIVADILEMGRIRSLKLYFEGEPLLNPDLPLMVSMAREAGIADRIEVTSNGSLLNARRATELIEAGLDYLQISVYSVNDSGHREIAGVNKFTPRQIMENVRGVVRLRNLRGASAPFV